MARSVREILAQDDPSRTAADAALALERMTALSGLLDDLFEAVREDSPDDWEMVYDAIFGVGSGYDRYSLIQSRAKDALSLVGRGFPDYCDPDEGYDDDARAWRNAFDEALEKVREDVARLDGDAPRPGSSW